MPWDDEKRRQVKRKIDKEAARAAARLDAKTVAMICFFDEGAGTMILMEGGTAPVPGGTLYAQLAHRYSMMEQKAREAAGQGPTPTNDGPAGSQ